jgi:hypothetical protein
MYLLKARAMPERIAVSTERSAKPRSADAEEGRSEVPCEIR